MSDGDQDIDSQILTGLHNLQQEVAASRKEVSTEIHSVDLKCAELKAQVATSNEHLKGLHTSASATKEQTTTNRANIKSVDRRVVVLEQEARDAGKRPKEPKTEEELELEGRRKLRRRIMMWWIGGGTVGGGGGVMLLWDWLRTLFTNGGGQ